MPWKENVGNYNVPAAIEETHIPAYFEILKQSRSSLSPQEYVNGLLTVAACNRDAIAGGDTFRTALTNARNDERLIERYDLGFQSGMDEKLRGTEPKNHAARSIYEDLGSIILAETGRHRIDLHDGYKTVERKELTIRRNELSVLRESELSPDFKALLLIKLFQSYTAEMLRLSGEHARDVARVSNLPEVAFTEMYIGKGTSQQQGIAKITGCYEGLSNDIAVLFERRFDEESTEASKLTDIAFNLPYGKRPSKYTLAEVRRRQFKTFASLEKGNVSSARNHLQAIQSDIPSLFSPQATRYLVGETIQKPVPKRLSKAEDFHNIDIRNAETAAYCRDILGLSDREVKSIAVHYEGAVLGAIIPQNSEPTKQYDLLHLERRISSRGSKTGTAFSGRVYVLSPEGETEFEKLVPWHHIVPHTLLTMIHLGRWAVLEPHMHPDEVMERQAELAVKLRAERAIKLEAGN